MYSSSNLVYALTVLEAIEKIQTYSAEFHTATEFYEADDQLQFNAVQLLLLTIGEESKKIDESVKAAFRQIPWVILSDFRNKLAHNYRSVNPEIVFDIVKNYLPQLKTDFIELVNLIDFPKSDFKKIMESVYYKHIRHLF